MTKVYVATKAQLDALDATVDLKAVASNLPINVMDTLVPYADVMRDGSTNDSAALQARHDLADNTDRAVYYPGGVSAYMAVNLTLGSNARVFGDHGATVIKMPASASASGGHRFIFTNKQFATTGNAGIRIAGITFDGNVASSNSTDEFYFGVRVYGVTNFSLDWCTFRDLRGDAVYINRTATGVESEDFHLDHIFLSNVGVDAGVGNPRQGISIVQGRRFTIRNVTANKVSGPAGTGYIVDLEPNTSGDTIEDFTIDGIHGYDCQGGVGILQIAGGATRRGFVNNISLKDGPTNTIQDVVHITLADSINIGSGIYTDTTPGTGLIIWLSAASPPTNITVDATKVETQARAATTVIQANTKLAIITGSGPISSVVATWAGHHVIFKLSGAVTFTDGLNLKIAGSFTTGAADSTFQMVCDGTNWYQTAAGNVN